MKYNIPSKLIVGLAVVCILILSETIAISQNLYATIKGQVFRETRYGNFPAEYVHVKLISEGSSVIAYSDPEGWYYFYKVKVPGAYTIRVEIRKKKIEKQINPTTDNTVVPDIIIANR